MLALSCIASDSSNSKSYNSRKFQNKKSSMTQTMLVQFAYLTSPPGGFFFPKRQLYALCCQVASLVWSLGWWKGPHVPQNCFFFPMARTITNVLL